MGRRRVGDPDASATLYRVLAVLLVFIAVVFTVERAGSLPQLELSQRVGVAGVAAGFGIGVVAALMGVAGGELLIPAFVLLFAADTKLAGSLSLPTMLVAFLPLLARPGIHGLGREPGVRRGNGGGSVAGSVVGGLLLGFVPEAVLVPLLSALLLFSAYKVWWHA